MDFYYDGICNIIGKYYHLDVFIYLRFPKLNKSPLKTSIFHLPKKEKKKEKTSANPNYQLHSISIRHAPMEESFYCIPAISQNPPFGFFNSLSLSLSLPLLFFFSKIGSKVSHANGILSPILSQLITDL